MDIRRLIITAALTASALLLLVEVNAYLNEVNASRSLAPDAYVSEVYAYRNREQSQGEGKQTEEKQKGTGADGDSYTLPVIEPAADFTLMDVNGKRVSLRELYGSIKIINFIYTSCPDTCSVATRRLSLLQKALIREGLLGDRVEIISITLDPGRDTARELKYYGEANNADERGWVFLRGTEEATRKVLSDYDVWMRKGDNGLIDHVMRVYLVDDNNSIREIYNLAYLQPELVLSDIEAILTEKYSGL